MNDNKFNIGLNLPKRHKKGVMTTFGVMVVPFYRAGEAMKEGSLVVLDETKEGFVKTAVAGTCENGVFGVVAQEVYDPATLGELSGYQFHNNTKARIGDTVGVIVGQGYIETINYTGTVTVGAKLYAGTNGALTTTQSGNDLPVGVSETAGQDGSDYIRVRVNFDFYADTVDEVVSNSGSGSNSN